MGIGSVAVKRGRGVPESDDRVDFGFALPTRGPLAQPEIVRRLARKADALGLCAVSVSDHVVLPTRSSAPYPYADSGEFPGGAEQDYLEPLTLAAWLLAATRRIRVVISVLVVPYRNPVVTAKQIAMLDVLSGGRIIVGCGTGWWPEEFEALDAPPFAERGRVTDEYLAVMKALWTQDAPRFEGKHYRLGDVTMRPKPVQRPHPPLWIGGHTAPALRRAGVLGDAWHPIGLRTPAVSSPDEYARHARRVRAHAAAIERAGRGAGRGAGAAPFRGPATKVAEDIRAYLAVGVRTMIFDVPLADPRAIADTMSRFVTDVRPKIGRPRR
jgi:probable F420-dependent oxidoreductase